jgi:hypothetical protein
MNGYKRKADENIHINIETEKRTKVVLSDTEKDTVIMDQKTSTNTSWKIAASEMALRTVNPIRDIVDKIDMPKPDPSKPIIRLSIGDPTVYGNMPQADTLEPAIIKALQSNKFNGMFF